MYICLCKGITESNVRALGRAGLVTPEAVAAALGLDREGCCGRCLQNIGELAALAEAEQREAPARTQGASPSSRASNPVSRR
jgi:bacterioferritin-associated ferredoxin